MNMLCVAVAALLLSGCASTGAWRTVNIDGSNEAAFGESLARMNDGLSDFRARLLALALVDIASTRAETAGETEDGLPAYTEADFRNDLNGLSFDEVLALADQSGPSIRTLYYARRWRDTQSVVNQLLTAGDNTRGQSSGRIVYQDTNSGETWAIP